jgi:uncharacterized RDD family membrane protein YckC
MSERPRRPAARTDGTINANDAAVGLVVTTARAGRSAARFVLLPFRVLGTAPGVAPLMRRRADELARTGRDARVQGRERAVSIARDELAGSVPPSLIDAAMAGPLPEILVRSSFEHRLPERIAGELDEVAVQRLVQQMFNSAEFEHALESALSSPRVRAAFTSQGTRFADEIVGSLRRRAASLDDRLSRKRDTTAPFAYAGLASRAAAFTIDLLLAQIVFLVGTALVALVVSLVGSLRPEWLAQTLAGVAWIASVAAYFVVFWTLAGQTPGMRLAGLRVADPGGRPPSVPRALLRFVALIVAIVPLFLGLATIPFDRRRRGFQDMVAGTAVLYSGEITQVG